MQTLHRVTLSAATLATAIGLALPAGATPVLTNGGFESGLNGWSTADVNGGSFGVQTGTTSPLSGTTVAAPTEGTQAAMSDSAGDPGAHLLWQRFTASGTNVLLKFDLLLKSFWSVPVVPSPDTLDFSGAPNQQARIDILLDSVADDFSVSTTDVLLNLYQTPNGAALPDGYVSFSVDVSSLMTTYAGQSLRLRFAETDNLGEFQMGVDNVRFVDAGKPVPEPASWTLAGLALLGLAATRRRRALAGAAVAACLTGPALADTTPLTLLDPSLQVTTVLGTGVSQPIGMVFIGRNDYLVLEKASGQVKRVLNGTLLPTPVLDLAVNSASERGLLSMALDPQFSANGRVYIFWTESSTGADNPVVLNVPLRGNRVDMFIWDGNALTFGQNIIKLRSLQTDNTTVPGQPTTTANANPQGNHNGGTVRIGPDGKLYIFFGDQGRRGWLQNLVNGPFLVAPFVDDTFGGPSPDDNHLAGVVLRLNTDGTTPPDNPFFGVGASLGGEVGANIQKLYSYGHRNGFGMAFDPLTGYLWLTENADDAYSEINRLVPGMNGGWIQFAGPISRIRDWRTIEATQFGLALQQRRYPPTRASYTPAAAGSRLFMLPGAVYKDPELSARYEIGPSGAAFVDGNGLGPAYNGTFWFGSARAFQAVGANGGSLYRLRLTADRLGVDTSADPRLADKVIDNQFRAQKFEGTETETMVIGRGFGTVTDIQQGPDGSLYVVSLTDNAIYRISAAP
ncbi:PQQ-dependent sugar dehydrogenase [Pseudaquabacterium pictum]|uniref:Glucose/Sorbosone dehydrogenase domain-containing protein n=1 Tax=Pseudaquabacterium pictum TaxID=2315236 RepID=A0A480AVE5_9BURK|nr:PQQ-dependent sugar dehydrogenase [Rubrivivax pictus]GCL64866.1 hypothetical protein AQPW35_39470 [Rubrivivax pictus]